MRIRAALLFGFLAAACADEQPAPSPRLEDTPMPSVESRAETPEPPDERPLVIFLGDSLTAGFGLGETEAFPARVAARLAESGREVRVVNAGISGDTTAGGLARLDWLLRQEPNVLVVALGGNDGLRGVPLESSEANLREIVEKAKAAGVRVLLAGMLIPPNYGPDYTGGFAAIYPRLAEDTGVPLIPFLLEGVAARPELNLEDGIHPNARGQQRVADTVFEHLTPIVDEVTAD